MKLICMMATAILTVNVFATEIEEAKNSFALRGQGAQHALTAANLYNQAYAKLSSTLEKANAKVGEAEAMYFVGTHSSGKDAILSAHERGFEAAQTAIRMLKNSVSANPEFKTPLARAYYFYSSNLGKWGEARGILRSLARWPELKENTFNAKNLDESVEQYGVFRILGRGYMKVPSESNQKAYDFIRYGYDKTKTQIDGVTISANTTTVLYFLEIAQKVSKTSEFCEVFYAMEELAELPEEMLMQYSLDKDGTSRLPETKEDISKFKKDSDIQSYARSNC